MAKKKEKNVKEAVARGEEHNSEMCDLFFTGGREQVQKVLVGAIKKARSEKNVSKSKLNRLCYFEEDGLDKCEIFEKDSSKMTHEIFCRAACALELKVEDVLKLDLTKDRVTQIVEEMTAKNAGLAAALPVGGNKAKAVANEEVAPVYACIKILNEI